LYPCLIIFSVYAEDTTSNKNSKNSGFNMDILQSELQNSAVTESSSVDNNDVERGNILPVLMRIFAYLSIVIIVILVIAWVFKKIGLPGTVRNNKAGSMDLLEILPLSQNRNISMIRIADAVYILGQCQQSMLLIEKIEGQKALELISASKDGNSIVQFKDALNTFMGKFKKNS
jgi:flagellar biogenesis protein FliO